MSDEKKTTRGRLVMSADAWAKVDEFTEEGQTWCAVVEELIDIAMSDDEPIWHGSPPEDPQVAPTDDPPESAEKPETD